jgi:endoglucanase
MAPTYYGFNFLSLFIWDEGEPPMPVEEAALDFMARYNFNFARLPTDYRHWIRNHTYDTPDETAFTHIDAWLAACRVRGIHLSLNGHRVPGYCINWNHLEKHNLWQDPVAQDGFVFQWEMFARRYLGIPGDALSFDLVNEPPSVGDYGLTRENHAALIRRVVAAIRAIDPDRPIVIDGLGGGHLAMPELADLGSQNVMHSGRGYQPMPISHHQATWWSGHADAPPPMYPGQVWDGVVWDRDALRAFYQPWRDVQNSGVNVHIGEFGCYNKTPNDIALRWFRDLFSVYREMGWGYALWNFEGDFGIASHGRPGVKYERMFGYDVDRELLDLMLESRVAQI